MRRSVSALAELMVRIHSPPAESPLLPEFHPPMTRSRLSASREFSDTCRRVYHRKISPEHRRSEGRVSSRRAIALHQCAQNRLSRGMRAYTVVTGFLRLSFSMLSGITCASRSQATFSTCRSGFSSTCFLGGADIEPPATPTHPFEPVAQPRNRLGLTRIRFPRRGLISAVGSRSRVRQCPFPSVDEPEPGSSLLALGVNC